MVAPLHLRSFSSMHILDIYLIELYYYTQACIEVVMHLEDASPTLEEVLANTELLVACYYIIESAVSYMASDRLKQLDRRQRDQVR